MTVSAGQNSGELRTFAPQMVHMIIWAENGARNGNKSDWDSDSKYWRIQKEKKKNKCLKMAFCTNNTNYSHSCELIAIFPNHCAAY